MHRIPLRGAHRIRKLIPWMGANWTGGVVNFETGWIARKATAAELEAFMESHDALEPIPQDDPPRPPARRVLPLHR